MTTEITLGHKPSERIPEHEWLVDPERIAQPHPVVGPRVELSLVDGAPIATALPAMVVHHDLRDITHLVHAQLV